MKNKEDYIPHSLRIEPKFILKKNYTELTVSGEGILLKCYIENRLSSRNRRQFLLSVHNQIRPLFEFVRWSGIHHGHHLNTFENYDLLKEISKRQGIQFSEKTEFGYFIRGVRTKLGMTQERFSKLIGISREHLSRIEHGHQRPTKKILDHVCKIKNAPGDYP